MDVALYDPSVGYYRRASGRIGYGPGSDFLTATASAPLFGALVAAACAKIVGAPASESEFVEIGAEPAGGVLKGVSHGFRSHREIRLGDSLRLEGPSIVFSNELLDAQPFRRFRFRAGHWRELGVSLEGDAFGEVELESSTALPSFLPSDPPEGYLIDAPMAAATLARKIGEEPWTGLFVAFDYGKSWDELSQATPAGTARAYRRHKQGNDLLAHPGDQDLTCHVCWDWIADALSDEGFVDPCLESQEAFFAHHAGHAIAQIAAAHAAHLSREKLSLLQLLHPAHLGQKFQVLWAIRDAPRYGRAA
ncbi:MAG TPA: SAM-dependent methyltransferase [Opitutaceae bacterium]|jgi:SAM-dependent MidA family methyltransferase